MASRDCGVLRKLWDAGRPVSGGVRAGSNPAGGALLSSGYDSQSLQFVFNIVVRMSAPMAKVVPPKGGGL